MSLIRRPVRVRLRNTRSLMGHVHITEGQALATFLSTKLSFLNLTDVTWAGTEGAEPMPHLSIRTEQIVWVEPLDAGLHLSSASLPSATARKVELQIDGGDGWMRVTVDLYVAKETRMSDYLDANPGFIPLWSVQIAGAEGALERIALNHRSIAVVRELDDTDPRRRG